MTLRADGPEYVPLRTFRDDDLLDPGSDPLIALMGALSNLNEGERVVGAADAALYGTRLVGVPPWRRPTSGPSRSGETPPNTYQTKPLQTDGVTMAVLGAWRPWPRCGATCGCRPGRPGRPCSWARASPSPWPQAAGCGTASRRPASGCTTPCSSRRRSPASPSTQRFK